VQKPSRRGCHTGPGVVIEGPGGGRFLITMLT